MTELIAPCGIDCQICDAYIATQTGDTALRQKLAENYLKNFGKEIPLDQLACDGCGEKGSHIGFCAVCEIRACAFAKGYKTCAECESFPCEKGSFIWKEGSKSLEKLTQLQGS